MTFFICSMKLILSAFHQNITLYGFTFSLWDVIILLSITGVVVAFLSKIFR